MYEILVTAAATFFFFATLLFIFLCATYYKYLKISYGKLDKMAKHYADEVMLNLRLMQKLQELGVSVEFKDARIKGEEQEDKKEDDDFGEIPPDRTVN